MKGWTMRVTVVYSLLACCLLAITPRTVHAQGSFGIGLIVGEPTGISWKYQLNDRHALDGALGFSPFDRMRLHVDYLWLNRAFNDRQFTLSYGAGLAIGFGKRWVDGRRGVLCYVVQEAALAIRIPVGLSYQIPRTPLEAGLEIAPLLILGPEAGWGFDGGLILRIYP
jgi:hypothetical protein